MSETDKVFSGAIPDVYDEYLVPLIFEVFARDLAQRVAQQNPLTVLETATGSGVVTRALMPMLAPDARYWATDLNAPMLERAKRMQASDNRIAGQVADAVALPFEDDSVDAACCQFGVMFFPDRVEGYREARRVLKPGGHFFFNVWDGIEDNEFADVVTRVAGEVFPEDPPLFLARTPHGYGDVAKIEADLRAAGYEDLSIDTITETSAAPTPRHPAIAYCEGTPLRNEIEARDASRLAEVTERAALAIAEQYGEGPVAAKIQGHVVTAIA